MPLRGEATNQATYLHLRPVPAGTSQVHTGYHDVYGRDIVQKTVPKAALLADSVARGEPEILLNIDHPAIPRIYEAQYEPTRPGFITFVMDEVGDMGGGQVVLGRHPRPSVGQAVQVGLRLLSALEYIHVVSGIVHRDIKPDNIRLAAEFADAWLIDFNMAGQLDSSRKVLGAQTPIAWMAPEVPLSLEYGIPSEIYSFGVVFYEVIRGRMMSSDFPMGRQEDRVAAGKRAFPDAHFNRWPPEVPANVRRAVTKAMSADPAKRWQTAAEMRQALGSCVFVDWMEDPSGGQRWIGSWPSNRLKSERVEVEVEVQTITSGPNRARRRARARYRPTRDWRRLSELPDRFIDTDSELRHFFDDVERRLASIRPAS